MVTITIRVEESVRESLRTIAAGAECELSDVVRVGLARVLAVAPTADELGRAERAEGSGAAGRSAADAAKAGRKGAKVRWKPKPAKREKAE